MNKRKHDGDWWDFTWSPITGCLHGCTFGPYRTPCYAKTMAGRFPKTFSNGFEPTFHPERLSEPARMKKPARIFVCSMSDLFQDPAVDPGGRDGYSCWTRWVLQAITQAPQHTFLLLTKRPDNAIRFLPLPPNVWLGTTLTDGAEHPNLDRCEARAGLGGRRQTTEDRRH